MKKASNFIIANKGLILGFLTLTFDKLIDLKFGYSDRYKIIGYVIVATSFIAGYFWDKKERLRDKNETNENILFVHLVNEMRTYRDQLNPMRNSKTAKALWAKFNSHGDTITCRAIAHVLGSSEEQTIEFLTRPDEIYIHKFDGTYFGFLRNNILYTKDRKVFGYSEGEHLIWNIKDDYLGYVYSDNNGGYHIIRNTNAKSHHKYHGRKLILDDLPISESIYPQDDITPIENIGEDYVEGI